MGGSLKGMAREWVRGNRTGRGKVKRRVSSRNGVGRG